jgi:demethylmenaquinone methyltransferase/2-methoxy-6-polyprenyl-1,4-benzoquinol methylase
MASPPRQPLRALYLLYFEHLLPRIGRVISKHTSAYEWLPASARVFPSPSELAVRIARAGFTDVHYSLLMGGVTALHVAVRTG